MCMLQRYNFRVGGLCISAVLIPSARARSRVFTCGFCSGFVVLRFSGGAVWNVCRNGVGEDEQSILAVVVVGVATGCMLGGYS
jgi:hypothetical protein